MARILNYLARILRSLLFAFQDFPVKKCESSTVYILGNGPSLNDDMGTIEQARQRIPIVCMNDFLLSERAFEFKPEYYVLLDPGYFTLDPDKVPESQLKINRDLISRLTIADWDLTIFIPESLKKTYNTIYDQGNPHIRTVFFNNLNYRHFFNTSFFYRINFSSPKMQNVLIASIFLCIQMDFRTIFITGADHSWFKLLEMDKSNTLMIRETHFYDNEFKVDLKPIHKLGIGESKFLVHEYMVAMADTFRSYHFLEQYSKTRNTRIYNASAFSFIDAFERKPLG
jgi:hypothetical protein